MKLLPIVEGPGDKAALPILLRRLLHAHEIYDVEVMRPYTLGDVYKVVKNFRRYVLTAAKEGAPILWTLDLDDGCPVEILKLLEKELPAGVNVPLKFSFFVREYESMFICEQQCLLELGLVDDCVFPEQPEAIRGAKEWISKAMPSGRSYKETVHQAKLSHSVDLGRVRERSSSFRHLEKALLSLVQR